MSSPLPEGPRKVVGVNYLRKDRRWLIVITNSYSSYLDVKELDALT